MTKRILIDAVFQKETRVVKLDSKNNIEDIEYETANKNQIKSNVYLAKVIRIEGSLQAAFIEYSDGKSGFLPFSEINPDYYNIPQSDKSTPVATDKVDNVDHVGNDVTFTHEEDNDHEIDKFEDTSSHDEPLYKRYKIQEVIKKGQIFLVQAQKEERGNKGASFTTYISLAGKYCVLMPNKIKNNGISRRVSSVDERRRLKSIIDKIIKSSSEESSAHSIILRTAATGRSSYELKKDYDYLISLWNNIRETVLSAKAPAFIHVEDGIIQKTIRDFYDKEVSEVLVQGRVAYEQALEFMKNILPTDVSNVKQYNAKTPIFTRYGIEDNLMKLYQPIVNLPSGGYIVINPTEALISIDVNSGKSTAEHGIEATALKTNLEAVKEIARQSRIRDLAGLIVIDFIDMYEGSNRKSVEKSLKDHFHSDKAKTQISSISMFGLLEMSRQRLRASFLESNTVICNHCNGKGVVRADESNAMLILRTLENEIYKGSYAIVNIYAHLTAILYLMNYKRVEIKLIEDKYSIKVNLYQENNIGMTSDSFSIEKIKAVDASLKPKDAVPAFDSTKLFQITHNSPDIEVEDEVVQKKSSRRRINKNRPKPPKNLENSNSDIAVEEAQKDIPQPQPSEESKVFEDSQIVDKSHSKNDDSVEVGSEDKKLAPKRRIARRNNNNRRPKSNVVVKPKNDNDSKEEKQLVD